MARLRTQDLARSLDMRLLPGRLDPARGNMAARPRLGVSDYGTLVAYSSGRNECDSSERHMTKNVIAALGIAAILSGGGCRSTAPVVHTPQQSTPARPHSAQTLPDSMRWVRDSAEYRAAMLQTYRVAAATSPRQRAATSPGSWAVILDADETVISNLQYQIERAQAHQPYSDESWRAWVARREATPLPGAAAFLARVRELGGRIAIVTNRLESECADTAAVFRAHQLLVRHDALPAR